MIILSFAFCFIGLIYLVCDATIKDCNGYGISAGLFFIAAVLCFK